MNVDVVVHRRCIIRSDEVQVECPPDTCLRERVRDRIHGHDIIDWAAHDFESLLARLPVVRLQGGSTARMTDGAIYVASLPTMVHLHARCRTSHVLVAHLNENWGAFSTTVPNRTAAWGDWSSHMIAAGCTPDMVQSYLDDPAVKAVVTTQHTAVSHPTILSIPVGVTQSRAILEHLAQADGAKTQDLLINNSGWEHRQSINERVIANFGGQLRNTYGLRLSEYFDAIARSRFVLCPSGMGWDSHRLWETLLLGSIPIVEHSEGWHAVLDDLPALSVTHFDQVTPDLLASAYPAILSQCDRFDYGKLTTAWWVSRIRRLLDNPVPFG